MLYDLALSMARMETKLDQVLSIGADHEARLRSIEVKQASPLRIYALPISLVGTFASAIMTLILALSHR